MSEFRVSEFLDRISKLSPQRLALLADELNERLEASERRRRVPLAIVGIGCRLPGGVHEPEGFWKLLSEGVDAVQEVPRSRWNVEEFYDRNPDVPGKMATRWGGFIDDPDLFDPKFFGIAPAEAISMDPQQRLLLETTWEALEHAGIAPARLAGTQTGVFVGICNGDYSQVMLNAAREAITPYFASGLSHAIAAGRISYVFGLQGPSLAIDTSCSASLAAVHLACQSLRLGECDAAIAGGVNLMFNPDITIALSQSRMMAPDGRCKAFSESANGFVRGEGCGVVVLKRLPDAIRDGNRILAVIRGSACNQDGRSSGLTAPNGPSQEAVIAAAISDAGLQPDDVDVIETHGTGTALGDPIEAGALNAVFASRSGKSEPLRIGSVKTNIGHLESAAGIAGLIKMVLAIQHGKIPASLHLDKPNSRIEWERLPLKVPARLEAWNQRREKRVGGVSSFGFSGTNVHVVVEEYLDGAPSSAVADRPFLFTLSAKTESALKKMTVRLQQHLAGHPSLPLADVAHTLNTGRSNFEYRAAVIAASQRELLERLSSLQKSGDPSEIYTGLAAGHASRVAFAFGEEHCFGVNFGRELYDAVPAFRESIQRCEEILRSELEKPLTSVLYPEADARTENKTSKGARDLPSDYRAATDFAVQYALAELWRACGIEPSAVLGCGVGEYVAASIAGVFSLEDGLRLALARGRGNSSEFYERARRIFYNEPRIHLIPNSEESAAPINSAEYWLHRSDENAPCHSALSALTKENSVANVYIGDGAELQKFEKGVGKGLPGKWLASLDKNQSGLGQFLSAAASLYVLGCNLDMSGFYRDAARTVSLPTYPFERERYWLDSESDKGAGRGISLQAASEGLPSEVANDEWVYDLVWESKPLQQKIAQHSAARLDEELIGQMAVTPASRELMRVAEVTDPATPVYATYVVQALQEAGLVPLPKAAFTLDELIERLKVIPARHRVLARMLGILVEDKIVEQVGDRFRFVDFQQRPDADSQIEMLGADYPECLAEMNVLRRCGKKLSAVLRGEYDPMQLVFADGSIEEAEQIYERSPVCRFFNDKAAKVVRAAIRPITERPVMERPARILEIGAGTGATTAPILLELAGTNIEYTFTDISGVFLSRARSKFAHVAGMVYRVLDIENDPVGQGFEAGSYDVVIAANVLHATADLRRTIAHIRKLLAPGGIVVLVEGVRPDRWLDLTFGLTDGWWRFTDFDLRPEHPLISAENWARVLGEAGIGSSRTISYVKDDGSFSQQVVIVAQVDASDARKPSRDWIIFADESGVGDALHKTLTGAGEPCEIIRRPHSTGEMDSVFRKLSLRPDTAAQEILYLWGMDVAAPIDSVSDLSDSVSDLLWGTQLCSEALIHLIQSLRARKNAHLWMVTRGAQATESFAPNAGGAIQSMIWGVGRTFGLENPEQHRALIDLDPAAAPEAAAASLMAELSADNNEDQVAYRGGQRMAPRLQRSSLKTNATASTFTGLRKDGSYLLVGGLGGLGLRLAKWATEQHPAHLILLGRTGTGENAGAFAAERQQVIQEIRDRGVKVTVVEGNVASDSEMKALFQRFGGEFPPLRGVFHTATAVSGATLGDLADEQIESMLRPKVAGTWVLHELTKTQPLDFFMVFSSTTSLLGAKGMAHYAAANQFLDSFAHYRRAAGLPMLSVNWGAWDVMRLASQRDRTYLSETGILPMQSEKAFNLFGDLVASRRAQVMIANIDWDVLRPVFEARRTRPLLEKLGNARAKHGNASVQSIPALASLRPAIEMTAESRKKFIETFVLEQAAQVLGFRRGELPPVDVELPDIGLDSLMAVDLKNRLQIGLGQELSSTIVFDYPTVSGLVGMLETVLWSAHGSAETGHNASPKDEIRI